MSRAGCICAALLAVAMGAAAQELPLLPPGRVVTRAQNEAGGLIRLDVVVTDKSGAPVTGLGAEDFSLLENGQPQEILSFHAFDGVAAKPDPPVQIILMIDTIELQPELARNERLAVESFLRENGGRLQWPVSIYQLADTGLWTVAHPQGDGNALASDLAHNNMKLIRRFMRTDGGAELPSGFGPKDSATDSALKALGLIASDERRVPGRKLLIWVGPGWGVGSGGYTEGIGKSKRPFYAICWFSTLLREARMVLYSFTVGEKTDDPRSSMYLKYMSGVESEEKAGYMYLERKVIAMQSGGRVMDTSFDLVQEIRSCVRDANTFYTLTFDPARADHADEYHDLKVQVDKPGLTARTSMGYYDQPFYQVERVPAPRRVSVAQLEQMVEEDKGKADAEMARQIDDLELTERLSGARLTEVASKLRGKKSQVALVALADASAFRDPPADEIPEDAAPDARMQQQMLSKTGDYLSKTLTKLPDLFATRLTVRYQETPQFSEAGVGNVAYQPLHVTDTAKAQVHYRGGVEVADVESKSRKEKKYEAQLITYGTFGPVLQGVSQAIERNGGLTWGHWERGAAGAKVAVFRYAIALEKSLYEVGFCCTPDRDWTGLFERYVGYHGVIAIDPASGAILRLQWDADLTSTTPMAWSQIEIEYGPVDIAGKTYVCPLRSISIVRGRSVSHLTLWDESFTTYGPFATMLNDISFSGYHVFRSESRIMPGFDTSN